MRTVIDQMGLMVEVPDHPVRIISLVPSQTELLFDLGLDEELVGLTRFCIHPADSVAAKERIGGTKKFDIDKIRALQPDLIIGNKEENYQEGINELKRDFPVWMSDIVTLDDAYEMMIKVGEITGRETEANELVSEIRSSLLIDTAVDKQSPLLSCAYLIWRKPYMVAAKGTFIDNMLKVYGVRNAFAGRERYPEVTADDIAACRPGLIFLSSEPYAFSEKHILEFQEICPDAKVCIVDGEMFSWYGSRLRYAGEYLDGLRARLTDQIV